VNDDVIDPLYPVGAKYGDTPPFAIMARAVPLHLTALPCDPGVDPSAAPP